MFENFMNKKMMLLLPVTAVALIVSGCQQDKGNDIEVADVDLAEPNDMFETPVQPNPLNEVQADKVIARIGDEDITHGQIIELIAPTLQQYAAQIPGEQLPQLQAQMYAQAKDQLISQKLLEMAIDRENIEVADSEVEEAIETERANLPEGQSLEEILASQGADIAMLKSAIKEQLAIQKLSEMQTADVENATEAEALEFYNTNTDSFLMPERVSASHILITFDDDGSTDATKAEKKARLEGIRGEILAGDITFEDAAKEYSEDPGSAQNGGLYENITRGKMVPEFETAAFTQEVGEIGEIIETSYGYHILKVSDHAQEGMATFEDEKERIIDYLTNQKKMEIMQEYMQELRDESVELL